MKKYFPFCFIILFVSCDQHVKTAQEIKQDDSIAKVVDKIVDSEKIAASKPNPEKNWQEQDDTDKMTSKIEVIKYVVANEELELKAPYDGGVTASLVIRKRRGETNVYMHISRGQFNNLADGIPVKVRFDDNKAETYYCSESNDGDATVIFFNNESKFISKLKKAKKTLIEAEFYDNGYKVMEFDTHDFVWK